MFPLDEFILELFVTSLGRRLSHTTTKVYLCAVQFFSYRRGFKDKISDMKVLFDLLKGIRRYQGDSKARRKRAPILMEHLKLSFKFFKANCSKHDETMWKALVTTSFLGFLRCSEYTSPGKQKWDKKAYLSFTDITFSGKDKVTIHIKSSKTDPFRDGCFLRLLRIESKFCPVRQLNKYFKVHKYRCGPLFQFEGGKFVTRSDVAKMLKRCFQHQIDLNTHSFRIVGASAAAMAGVSYYVIQTLGRWKSETFKCYITLSDNYLGGTFASLSKVTK